MHRSNSQSDILKNLKAWEAQGASIDIGGNKKDKGEKIINDEEQEPYLSELSENDIFSLNTDLDIVSPFYGMTLSEVIDNLVPIHINNHVTFHFDGIYEAKDFTMLLNKYYFTNLNMPGEPKKILETETGYEVRISLAEYADIIKKQSNQHKYLSLPLPDHKAVAHLRQWYTVIKGAYDNIAFSYFDRNQAIPKFEMLKPALCSLVLDSDDTINLFHEYDKNDSIYMARMKFVKNGFQCVAIVDGLNSLNEVKRLPIKPSMTFYSKKLTSTQLADHIIDRHGLSIEEDPLDFIKNMLGPDNRIDLFRDLVAGRNNSPKAEKREESVLESCRRFFGM